MCFPCFNLRFNKKVLLNSRKFSFKGIFTAIIPSKCPIIELNLKINSLIVYSSSFVAVGPNGEK